MHDRNCRAAKTNGVNLDLNYSVCQFSSEGKLLWVKALFWVSFGLSFEIRYST